MVGCRRITDRDSGVPYYLTATFRRNETGDDDVFDLEVTDFRHAWITKGALAGLTACAALQVCAIMSLGLAPRPRGHRP